MTHAIGAETGAARKSLHRILYVQVLVAALAGALLGLLFPATAAAMEPLGQGFVKLIHILIAPLVFCTLVVGIAGMKDGGKVGRLGGKALLYFEVMSTLALLIGVAVGEIVRPGEGFGVRPGMLDAAAVAPYLEGQESHGIVDFLLNIIPGTLVGAFADGDIVQVLFVAVLVGFAIKTLGPAGAGAARAMEQLERAVFALARLVMATAPVGAFGAMAYVVGKFGATAIENLLLLVATLYLAEILFVTLVLGLVGRVCGFSVFALLRYIKDEIFLVLGTSCAESALPTLMPKLERAGVDKSVVGLVVPAGYAFNSDGTNIYISLAVLFIAQATGTPLTLAHLATLLAVAMLTTKGAGGVTGSSFIALAATLSVVPDVPLAGLALILGIDRFLSEARSTTNVIGNAVATLAVARWEGALDLPRLQAVLGGQADASATRVQDEPAG